MLTLSQHLDMMRHALGKTPNSRHNLADTFNRAGRALVTSHPWAWRMRPPVTLIIPANTDRVALPADFDQVIKVTSDETLVYSVKMVDVEDIMRRRSSLIFEPLTLYIAFHVGRGQQTSTSPADDPRYAEIWPQQSTERSDIQLHYVAGWIDMDEKADADAVPNVPANFEQALILWARKYALDLENQEQSHEAKALEEELVRLRMFDAGVQTQFSSPYHSVGGHNTIGYRPFTRINHD